MAETPLLDSETLANSETLAIADLQEPVSQYFAALNAGEFQTVAALFAEEGVLQAPFEPPIVGGAAIAAYLEAEAKSFVLQPQQATIVALEEGDTEYQVGGSVQTPLFSVNVGWRFVVNSQKQISFVRVKLLASLEELFKLRQDTK